MVRPLFREPVRTLLTILAIALGVAVVLAIDLAAVPPPARSAVRWKRWQAITNWKSRRREAYRKAWLESCPRCPIRFECRRASRTIAVIAGTKKSLPLIGLDLVAKAALTRNVNPKIVVRLRRKAHLKRCSSTWEMRTVSGWVRALGTRRATASNCSSTIKSAITRCGRVPDSNGNESAIVTDLAVAQHALARYGRVDRILLKVLGPPDWKTGSSVYGPCFPPAWKFARRHRYERESPHAGSFSLELAPLELHFLGCWGFPYLQHDLRLGCSRRPEIGIVRALGASRGAILFAFVGEAACFGLAGVSLASPRPLYGNWCGSVDGRTVESLYVSSRPGTIELSAASVLFALAVGVGVAVASSYSPAPEASQFLRSRRWRGAAGYDVRVRKARDLWLALVLVLRQPQLLALPLSP